MYSPLTRLGTWCATMGESNFADFPFSNTHYTSPINFQWGMLAIISLKPSSLKASKGRREIGNTYLSTYFRVPSFCLTGSCLEGEGRESDQWKIDRFYIFVLLWKWSTRHYLPRNVAGDSVSVTCHLLLLYFSVLLCLPLLLLYLYLVTSHAKQNDSVILWNIRKWLYRLI